MKHASKESSRKKIKFTKKNIAITSGITVAVVIVVLIVFNFQFIYGLIVSPDSRNASDSPVEEAGEIPDTLGDLNEEITEDDNNTQEEHSEEPIDEKDQEDEKKDDGENSEKEKEEASENLPTIKLEIYEGPLYSKGDDICYYRVRAITAGEPEPEVNFSKDDSLGWLGPGKAQVNLKRDGGSYTLTATASNSKGSASDSLTLMWSCNRNPDIKDIKLPVGILYAGSKYEVYADAVDLDGDSMSYSWSVTGGSIEDSKANPISWNTPDTPGDYYITAIVTDSKGNKSDAKTIKASVKVKISAITSKTGMVGYIDVKTGQLVSLFTKRESTKTDRAERLAPLYIKYGKMFNLRADIAWAQMCHETGFLEFTGDVRPGQNNFAGIGATGGVPGNIFATEELGVIAHFAHLAWYYYPDHVNDYCSLEYDPRHFENRHKEYTGDISLGFLNGRWAPSPVYTDKIIQFANEIYGF